MKTIIAVGLFLVALIVFSQTAYNVDETQFVVITRFGEIQEVTKAPGLHFKAPFVESVSRLDNRLLRADVAPAGFPDVENQFLDIDAYVRYRIRPTDEDIRAFRVTLLNEQTAVDRISQIVIAALREEVGRLLREEIIGGRIIENTDGTKSVQPLKTPAGLDVREELTRNVTAAVQRQVDGQGFGINIEDVRIKRADFPDSSVESIYNRMRSERDVQAQRLRAEGENEFLTLTADVNRRVQVIAAEADERADELHGEGEAEAIRILADALNRDPDFFAFRRSLEAYATFLQGNSTVILSADSPLFQFLQNPQGLPTP